MAGLESGLMAVTVPLVLVQVFTYRRRRNALRSEGTSIAGVAVLMSDAHFTHKLQQVTMLGSGPDMQTVHDGNYCLAEVVLPESNHGPPLGVQIKQTSSATEEDLKRKPEILKEITSKRPLVMKGGVIIPIGLVGLGLAIMIIYYRFSGASRPRTGFESFMDSQIFGV